MYTKPSKLIGHLETKHPNHTTKVIEFFRRHEASVKRRRLIFPQISTKTGII